MMQLLWKTVWQAFKRLNIKLPHDPEILSLSIYPRETKTYVHTKMCIPMITVALLLIARQQKQH